MQHLTNAYSEVSVNIWTDLKDLSSLVQISRIQTKLNLSYIYAWKGMGCGPDGVVDRNTDL